ncbi:MAG: [FeFe] hydrogenase, group A [Slackia sp.]|uniref:[FeFe] hydrogenase, group A n=1 Tax=uncultured Slackia sp. TaxID=665903 RepID=UPI00280435B4|nr:[FeFe] hydrogenase, group A [uncultured Slackia sp.]MDU6010664.1 [FeFe] hydrogenase, group A [Slackia sp.]
MVRLTIDGTPVSVPEGTTILNAAREAGITIPTLCELKGLNEIGACRVCVVKVEGEDRFPASCTTPVAEGMEVRTNTPEIVTARRSNVKMILSEHRSECTSCLRADTCALQQISRDLGAWNLPFPSNQTKAGDWDHDFPLRRDSSKCIKCMRCVSVCEKNQHCAVWDFTGTGPHMKVTVREGLPIADAGCSLCGQCITHCPTGALTARTDIHRVMEALMDPTVETVVQIAPAVRTSWGEGVGLDRTLATQGRMAAAARRLGFDRVFDTDFGADLTIMEEASEFVEYVKAGKKRPMFTSCCPGWVRFALQHYPDFAPQLSTSKSPHQMLGATIKNTLREQAEAEGRKLFTISIMPCVAKKYEAGVPQLSTEGGTDVDAVLTVREFDRMLRMFSIDCASLPEEGFDHPLGTSTGAGTIFGRTGGVMEAALRTAAYLITGTTLPIEATDCTAATPEEPWTSKTLDVGGMEVRIAIASGLENASKLLDALAADEAEFDFVEVMACPGGCVGGGGQPIAFNQELAKERAAVLNELDGADVLRMSHENPDVQKLYADWIGEPLSPTAEAWLHTDQIAWDI